jgi:hypothetical protein
MTPKHNEYMLNEYQMKKDSIMTMINDGEDRRWIGAAANPRARDEPM